MNLTIANRVIGGFAVTSILLLVLGFNSINVINGIADSTAKVNQVSVPALDASSRLQQKFVEMSKTTLVDYYATDYATVDKAYSDFNKQASEFEEDLAELKTVLADDPELLDMLPEVENIYEGFSTIANDLFVSKKDTLTLADSVNEKFEEIEFAADDASTYALDFIDMNDITSVNPDAKSLMESIESNLVSLVSGATDLRKEKNASTIEIIAKEIGYAQSSLIENTGKFKQMTGLVDLDGYDDFSNQVDLVIDMITSGNSIVNTKINWAAQVKNTDVLLEKTNNEIAAGITSLRSLVKNVNLQLDEMKDQVRESVSDGVTKS